MLADTHVFWYASRAAGTSALVLASLSVGLGLLTAGRHLEGRLAGRRIVHEALSLAVIASIAVHGLVLLGDGWMHPSLADVTVPFVSNYRTLWTSLGIVAGWSIALLGLSFYVRGRIGVARWRRLHRFTVLAWGAGLLHALIEGTDAGKPWFVLLLIASLAPALAALTLRVHGTLSRHRHALVY
jgi:sulfoxide reductase heme-binding subunit YedZ